MTIISHMTRMKMLKTFRMSLSHSILEHTEMKIFFFIIQQLIEPFNKKQIVNEMAYVPHCSP